MECAIMMINAASQNSSHSRMYIGGSGRANPLAAGLSIKHAGAPQGEAVAEGKSSLYRNFEKEMSRRLNEAAKKSDDNKKDAPDSASALLQSLSGAMGEVEELFGRQGATEVMANILTGTADGVTEESLITSIQNSLANLSRQDPNKAKVKQLAAGFNKDLSLALDQDLADEKLKSQQSFSLSYAIAQHFGSLNTSPEESDDSEKAGEATYEMRGFDETGAWGNVQVLEPDEAAAEEIQEAAEAGLNKAEDLRLADILKQDKGADIFYSLSGFLEDSLQDKEAAAFVDKCIMDSSFGPENSSPKMAEMLGQVYSKVAADGDADKVALFESYINNDFKNAINPVLSGMSFLPEGALEELGALQFKGLNGVSLAAENDAFSLNWGYKEDNSYDRANSKRVMQEDIQAVKAVKANNDAAEQDKMAEAWDASPEEKRLEESQKEAPQNSALNSTLAEKFAEERQQNKLDEALNTKFGQLSDSARADLEQYLTDNFEEEEAAKLLEHTQWNNNLMDGLTAIHEGIRASGADEEKLNSFVNFLNGNLKEELGALTEGLGGLSFEGWQNPAGATGSLNASFKFTGQAEAITVKIMAAPQMAPEAGEPQGQKLDTGYLVDLMA